MYVSSKDRFNALYVGVVALIYYAILCAKDWTWVFVSGDSGDWLATANWWMVPQPYGSPLYILLCRFVGLFPGNLAFNVTWFLSAIPAAVSVGIVFLIVKRLTGKNLLALTSSIVLLGSTVLLTQATVVEEYALTTMLLTLAIYFRINDRPYLTALFVGLSATVHVLVLIVALGWVAAEFRYWRPKIKALLLSVGIVAVFYAFILVLMSMDTPRLLAGGLNFKSLMDYLGAVGGSVVGQLSIFEFPLRLWDFVRIVVASLGLALVPIVYSVRQKGVVLIATVFVVVGYYLTCLDYTTWTFLTLAMPALAIMAGIGLDKLKPWHTKFVLVGGIVLILLNSIFMNANVLTQNRPIARDYYNDLSKLPSGAVVATNASFYSLGMFYAMSEGKQLIPVVYPYLTQWKFADYVEWINDTYGTNLPQDVTEVEVVEYFLQNDYDVYFAYYSDRPSYVWDGLVLEGTGHIRKVVEVQECSE